MHQWKRLTREEKIQVAMGWTVIAAAGVIGFKMGQKRPKHNYVVQ